MAFFLYDLLYTLPLSMLAAAASAQWFRLFEPSALLFVLTGVFCIAFCAFLRLGKWGRTVEILVLLLTAFLIVLLIPKEGERAAFLAAHQWVFYCFLLTFGVFLFEQLLSRFLYAKCVLAGLLLCGMAAAVIWNYALPGTIVSAAGFFILCTAAEAVRQEAFRKGAEKAPERRAEKDGKTGTARYMAYLSPFLLAVFLYGAFYHAPEEPYRWEFVKRAYADVASFVDRIRIGIFQNGSESYEDGIVGFSDRSIFPGTVSGGGHGASKRQLCAHSGLSDR